MKITDTLEQRINEIITANKELKRDDFNYTINLNRLNTFELCFKLDNEASHLLKSAIKELNLSYTQLERIEKICIGIMALDKVTLCKAEHIAEAIQYVTN